MGMNGMAVKRASTEVFYQPNCTRAWNCLYAGIGASNLQMGDDTSCVL